MLSFHLACSSQEALPNTDSFICHLDVSDVKRLIQFKVVKAFETDQYDLSDVEGLPYFDDFRGGYATIVAYSVSIAIIWKDDALWFCSIERFISAATSCTT